MQYLTQNKIYNSFSQHPLAPLYFKYVDILISKDLNHDVQYLLDIANSPMTAENVDAIAQVIIHIQALLKSHSDDFIEFDDLENTQQSFS